MEGKIARTLTVVSLMLAAGACTGAEASSPPPDVTSRPTELPAETPIFSIPCGDLVVPQETVGHIGSLRVQNGLPHHEARIIDAHGVDGGFHAYNFSPTIKGEITLPATKSLGKVIFEENNDMRVTRDCIDQQ